MKKILFASLPFALFILFANSCANEPAAQKETVSQSETTNSDDNQTINIDVENIDSPEEAINEINKALEGLGLNKNKDGEKIEIINFRKLKERMPEKLAGMKRTGHDGQTTGIGNMKVSTANATYKGDDKSLDISMTDTGGLGMAFGGMAFWSKLEIDKENEDGFERTTEIDGHKAYQKYDKNNKRSEIAVIYDDRILVTLSGRGFTFDEMEDILEDIDGENIL